MLPTPSHYNAMILFKRAFNLHKDWVLLSGDYDIFVQQIDEANCLNLYYESINQFITSSFRIDSSTQRPIQEGYNLFDTWFFLSEKDLFLTMKDSSAYFETLEDLFEYYGYHEKDENLRNLTYADWRVDGQIKAEL